MDGISRSRGWDKEIPHGVSPMEQLVLSDKWARKSNTTVSFLNNWGYDVMTGKDQLGTIRYKKSKTINTSSTIVRGMFHVYLNRCEFLLLHNYYVKNKQTDYAFLSVTDGSPVWPNRQNVNLKHNHDKEPHQYSSSTFK